MSKKNENRTGYKETKVGWIPEEWNANTLRSCFDLSSGITKPGDTVPVKSDQSPFPVYGGNGILGYSSKNSFTGETLVIGRVGEKCGCVHRVIGRYWITDNALYTSKWHQEANYQFFEYLLSYLKLNHLRNKGGQPLVSQAAIKTKQAAVPPLSEQKKIAEILTTWDEAIEQTRKLIDAKKRRKKALMQQLLTGKKRLPGFSKKWNESYLRDLFDERKEIRCNHLPLLAITGDRGIIPASEIERKDSSNSDKSKYKRIAPGDIGYNTMRMWQGVSAVSNSEGIVSPAYTICVPKKGAYAKFMGYFFKFAPVVNLFRRYSQGLVNDTLNLKFNNFARIKVKTPDTDEQISIAKVLSVTDREIKALEKKLAALEKQKRGLMQKLLTGEIRVKT